MGVPLDHLRFLLGQHFLLEFSLLDVLDLFISGRDFLCSFDIVQSFGFLFALVHFVRLEERLKLLFLLLDPVISLQVGQISLGHSWNAAGSHSARRLVLGVAAHL